MKMSTRQLSFCLLALLGQVLLATGLSAQENRATVDVILVKASNEGEGVDPGLKPYANTLQRLFRFKSYRQSSRQTLRLNVPGQDSISMAGGQQLTLEGLEFGRRGIKADIDWDRGSKRLLHTRINLQRGSPAILGGPRSQDGTWLLILTLR